MAKTYVVKLEIDGVSESITSINQLEGAVSELESQLKSADLGSAEFKKLSKELGNAKKELNVFQRDIDALDPAAKAEQFVKFGEGIAGGFAIATGAAALLGVESETLEKTMVQAQGAIAIAVGVRSLAESKLLETIAQSAIAERARAAATAISTFVTGAATTGLKLFRLALVSTGVGAIVVALGFLAANFDKVKSAVFKLAEYIVNFVIGYFNLYIKAINLVIEGLNKIPGVSIGTISALGSVSFATEEATKATFDYAEALGALKDAQDEATRASEAAVAQLERELKLKTAQGAKESELLKLRREIIVAKKQEAEADLRATGTQMLLLGEAINAKKAQIASLMSEGGKTEDAVRGELGLPTDDEMNKAFQDITQKKADAANDLAVFDAQVATDIREKNAENSAKQKEIDDAAAAQKLVDDEKALDTALTRQEAEWQQIQDLTNELALMAIESDYERAQEELIQQEIADLNAINGAENFFEQKLLIEEKYKNLSEGLKKEKAKSDIAIEEEVAAAEKAIQAAKLDNLANGFKLLSQLAGKSKAAQAISIIGENAVGIAKQIISTRAANAAALVTPQAVATSGAAALPVIAANNISLGLGIASSAAATAKALSALKQGGDTGAGAGGGGGGGGGAPNLGTPEETANIDFSFLGDGDVSEVGQTAPVQAYVIGSDVTSSQEASQVIKDQSTL